jgi:SprT protein
MTINNWTDITPTSMHADVESLIVDLNVLIKFVAPRKTKFGDFRAYSSDKLIITVNNNLNTYHASLTFFHELAHAICHIKYGRKINPHGSEWKRTYAAYVLRLLDEGFFPMAYQKAITAHAMNVKSSTCYDKQLMQLWTPNVDSDEHVSITSLTLGEQFTYNKHVYVLGQKRRTRYLCYRLPLRKPFTFSESAMVEMAK